MLIQGYIYIFHPGALVEDVFFQLILNKRGRGDFFANLAKPMVEARFPLQQLLNATDMVLPSTPPSQPQGKNAAPPVSMQLC